MHQQYTTGLSALKTAPEAEADAFYSKAVHQLVNIRKHYEAQIKAVSVKSTNGSFDTFLSIADFWTLFDKQNRLYQKNLQEQHKPIIVDSTDVQEERINIATLSVEVAQVKQQLGELRDSLKQKLLQLVVKKEVERKSQSSDSSSENRKKSIYELNQAIADTLFKQLSDERRNVEEAYRSVA